MADDEEGRSTPPPPRIVTPNPEAATPSQPATPYADVDAMSDALGVEPPPSVWRPPARAGGGIPGSPPPQPAPNYRYRPVEAMLRDPLGEVARKERRSLLGISAIAILVGRTGLVPEKIENFGITFKVPAQKALLWVFVAVVLYYAVAFIVYSLSDFLSYLYAVHQGRVAIRKQQGERVFGTVSLDPAKPGDPGDSPWSIVRFVTAASTVRGVFDFIIPLAIAVVAMWSLVGAVIQVKTPAPNAPATAPVPVPR